LLLPLSLSGPATEITKPRPCPCRGFAHKVLREESENMVQYEPRARGQTRRKI
jgi:hypothetical protein